MRLLGALPLAFAAAALAVTGYALYAGFTCGASASSSGQPGERCISFVHPFLPAYGLAVLASLAAIWRGRARVPLTLGVVGAAFGTLAGFTLGLWGIAISLLLVGCGIAMRLRDLIGWAALVAALLPLPALIVLSRMGAGGILGAWLIAFTPAVVWLGMAAIPKGRTSAASG